MDADGNAIYETKDIVKYLNEYFSQVGLVGVNIANEIIEKTNQGDGHTLYE